MIHRADGESLGINWSEGYGLAVDVVKMHIGPNLVFIIAPQPKTAKNPVIHSGARYVQSARVVMRRQCRTQILVQVAKAHQELSVWAEVVEVGP